MPEEKKAPAEKKPEAPPKPVSDEKMKLPQKEHSVGKTPPAHQRTQSPKKVEKPAEKLPAKAGAKPQQPVKPAATPQVQPIPKPQGKPVPGKKQESPKPAVAKPQAQTPDTDEFIASLKDYLGM